MNPYLSGEQLRQWAEKCLAEADAAETVNEEREWFTAMYEGILEVAETQDWLEGRNRQSVC